VCSSDLPRRAATDLLPNDWFETVRTGSEDLLDRIKATIENGDVVRALGRAGWVAPHFAPEHGGRGLTRDEVVTYRGGRAAFV
jgi:alkylation response protein AidB-like acyl-CoA dehydrogenase